jgi:hypothetical protein
MQYCSHWQCRGAARGQTDLRFLSCLLTAAWAPSAPAWQARTGGPCIIRSRRQPSTGAAATGATARRHTQVRGSVAVQAAAQGHSGRPSLCMVEPLFCRSSSALLPCQMRSNWPHWCDTPSPGCGASPGKRQLGCMANLIERTCKAQECDGEHRQQCGCHGHTCRRIEAAGILQRRRVKFKIDQRV